MPDLKLSPRQQEVFMGFAEGKNAAEIARSLGICRSAVINYRNQVLYKTGLQSNYDIIRYAIQNKLVP